MNENEHCWLCRVLHESAAEKTAWKRWKQGYVCPGLGFDQTGRTVGDEDGGPLIIKERTGSGERAKEIESTRRGEFIASWFSFVRYSYSHPSTSNM